MIRKVFPILALATFSSMLGMGIILPLLPVYAGSLGATGFGLGMIFASFPLARGILMPFFGGLSDRRGRKKFISIGLLVYALTSLGYIWATNIPQLIAVRFVHGAASAIILPIAQAYIGETSPDLEVGKWMGYFNAAFISGFGVGPLMGGLINDHFGLNAAFIAMGGLNLVAFLIAVVLLPEVGPKRSLTGVGSSLRQMKRSATMKGLFGFRLSFDAGMAIIFTFLPLFAANIIGLSSTQTGILLAVDILLMSLLQPVSGKIADKRDRRKLVILGGALSLGFLALVPFTHNFGQLLGLAVLGGLGGAIAMPATSALVVEEGRKFGMGLTMSVFYTAVSLGAVIGPLLGGLVSDQADLSSVFYLAAGLGLLGTGIFARFTGMRKV